MSFPMVRHHKIKQCHFHIISMGGNDVDFMWKPSGFHSLPGNFVVSLLFPYHFHGFHMDTMWLRGEHYMVSTRTPPNFCGFHMISTDGNDVISIVRYHKMETTSFPHHFYGWKQCGFQVETTWFPCPCLNCGLN